MWLVPESHMLRVSYVEGTASSPSTGVVCLPVSGASRSPSPKHFQNCVTLTWPSPDLIAIHTSSTDEEQKRRELYEMLRKALARRGAPRAAPRGCESEARRAEPLKTDSGQRHPDPSDREPPQGPAQLLHGRRDRQRRLHREQFLRRVPHGQDDLLGHAALHVRPPPADAVHDGSEEGRHRRPERKREGRLHRRPGLQ